MNDKNELSPEEKAHLERCREVNHLFDLVIRKTDMKEQEIFVLAYSGYTKEAKEAKVRFLVDVSTCPERVITLCQKLLNDGGA